ncbi:hypothetical protein F5B22DRAFT_134396 [Xylaria bambusicola]|uniref:uncharacterized protein n=1 Tax=Xylaria bambusicola TaxID=326684 RepID=UPI002007D870|nr:uncharacterized protein F5B22DRAFT_134396 [Xylaria bambusicola]KAI0517214.1 hypothetical protein F5B22DRAFT_134396 [Xylaria bambusicola]
MSLKGVTIAAISLLAAVPTANAHTWVEYLYRISSTGAFTGDPGYPIGYIPRAQGVSDDVHQNKIVDTSTNPVVCKPLSSSDAAQYPPLKAGGGDYIALQYQENGHVTQPDLTPRPYRGGNVYVYGTTQHQDTDGINDVLNSWTVDGKGGNKKGKLLASHYFDDGQCFQDAPGNPIAQERKSKYGVDQLFCQTDIQLPADLPSDGLYTLMWVWDWPMIVSDTQNVTEIYTSCAQIDLSGSAKKDGIKGLPGIKFGNNHDVASAAISSQVHNLVEATALGIGTNSPPAPTGLDDATSSADPAPTSTKTGKDHDHIKTVTVTAAPETITQYYTVTVGGDNNGGTTTSQPLTFTTATVTSETTKKTATSPENPFPTSFIPVTSVTGFLKVRAARVTGQARRGFRL